MHDSKTIRKENKRHQFICSNEIFVLVNCLTKITKHCWLVSVRTTNNLMSETKLGQTQMINGNTKTTKIRNVQWNCSCGDK